ncbi:efflux RND transporter periplasmic adaptor subunit [Methylocella tundrae]|uniref:Efflux transporter periplasmic adaptor subunit n=1 Tax=Methylocella tundrae TaxID=227605 RepID=A0A4U8YYZ2_METTU|nr:efflux RND transporter periplasmic adaptor subunit [Methylocella tundrae]WPP05643.1 efflux RND transporter periplasmic adaptor subunit [Methylocella tundrae]VFU08110.1 Efflux transporter periplasmic adaptor subunit [Methylocella tundrae]
MKPRSIENQRANLGSEARAGSARRIGALGALLAACCCWHALAHAATSQSSNSQPPGASAGPAYAAGAPEIPVVQPKVQSVTDYVEVTGTAASTNVVKLIARVEGYLDQIHFADGAIVKKGELLFTIQQAQYKAQLQQAQAQLLSQQAALAYAKIEVVRYTALFHKNAATATEVDKWVYQQKAAEAGILGAQGQIEVAQLNLDYTEVRAPFDGLMGKHLVDPGNVVGGPGQQTALAEINQLDPIYVTATLSEQQVLDIRANLNQRRLTPAELLKIPVEVGLENGTGFPYHGFIEFVAPQFDPTTGTLQVRGILKNPDRSLLPGLFVRMRLPKGRVAQGALLVPARAIGEDQGGLYLMLVNKNDVVEQRYVKTAQQVGDLRVITSGLNPDDRIVVGDLWRVSPGLKVVPKLTSIDAQ